MISAEQIATALDHHSVMIGVSTVRVRARHGDRVIVMRTTLVVPTVVLNEHKTAALSYENTRIAHLPHQINTTVMCQELSVQWSLGVQPPMRQVASRKQASMGS
jgi:hypothetical protein